MNKLKEIGEMNLKITWSLIKIGYLGYEFIQPQISKQDVCEYAYCLLENMDSDFDIVTQLIGERADDYEFNQILDKIAKHDNSNVELQTRKWIVYLTQKMISKLKGDYFEGLMAMTDFWISLGQPKNIPHIFQSVGNDITPQEYYTEKTYDLLLNKHKEWIEREIQYIIQIEKNL